ncbi:hypothetical protein BJ508DRAFT_321744 [Ascobolus immersus RN42]|uniref:Uncharacterized protein n=1 Tax=Ascobolus immersus RN42 TaxID=1160509 RepID=A0A3N4IKF7_ASCIM|nr:hypothetical protein BJ508DRAFT_321744 [Ascobolus immersus RN42]
MSSSDGYVYEVATHFKKYCNRPDGEDICNFERDVFEDVASANNRALRILGAAYDGELRAGWFERWEKQSVIVFDVHGCLTMPKYPREALDPIYKHRFHPTRVVVSRRVKISSEPASTTDANHFVKHNHFLKYIILYKVLVTEYSYCTDATEGHGYGSDTQLSAGSDSDSGDEDKKTKELIIHERNWFLEINTAYRATVAFIAEHSNKDENDLKQFPFPNPDGSLCWTRRRCRIISSSQAQGAAQGTANSNSTPNSTVNSIVNSSSTSDSTAESMTNGTASNTTNSTGNSTGNSTAKSTTKIKQHIRIPVTITPVIFKAFFPKDTNSVEPRNGLVRTQDSLLSVYDWDGTEEGYDAEFPDCPLRRPIYEF